MKRRYGGVRHGAIGDNSWDIAFGVLALGKAFSCEVTPPRYCLAAGCQHWLTWISTAASSSSGLKSWTCSATFISGGWHWMFPMFMPECIPAMSPTSCYNMIATPPPAESQFVNVSAILFSPEEDELIEIIWTTSDLVPCRHPERPRIVTVSCRPSPKASQGMCPIPILDMHFDNQVRDIVLTQGLNGVTSWDTNSICERQET